MERRFGLPSRLLLALSVSTCFAVAGIRANAASPASPSAEESAFLSEDDVAMSKMMTDMDVKPSGSVDEDFVAMMVPHHQGAVEMAQAELRHGHNEQLRRIAQEIIVEQQQEIVAMRVALGQPLPPAGPAPDQQSPQGSSGMSHTTLKMAVPKEQ
ncbi:hypothetical protein LMG28614_01429 [Paraburkholderia ultramafica]|uniref:DUF305 domain-containing protein n=1 Tax=Paraburkholderia ultramafica TaxID=1544867 RepID=A0A6S7BAE9_9BURK|nr:DUF305 domain-containing protein [Paraburkholderia ultramafica]CAB3782362.1 hypothetical protein LMG28614_01429 [Paraburkholderia ultramafica]